MGHLGCHIEVCPDRTDIARVAADQSLGKPADHHDEARAGHAFAGFGPAYDAVVGGNLDVGESAPAAVGVQVLDFCDFHALRPLDLQGIKSLAGDKGSTKPQRR